MRLYQTLAVATAALTLITACTVSPPRNPGASPPPWTPSPIARPGTLRIDCTQLSHQVRLPNTVIMSANTIAAGAVMIAGQPVREHCQVLGVVGQRISAVDGRPYGIRFEMRLPKDWNGRFYHQGNGGIDGNVVPAFGGTGGGPLTNALNKGFAVISSDAGHPIAYGPTFGLDPQARLDYGYQAVGTLTPIAKSIIQTSYGRGPDRSYIGGCSNGGRHALVAASRYPNDYDGYLAGAPGYNLPQAAIANIAGAQLYASVATSRADLSTAFTLPERQLVTRAILSRCDALDGATDGMVQDSQNCQRAFDIQRDVPTCNGPRNGMCLSPEQKTVISKIFNGPTTSTGQQIYASFPFDPGLSAPGVASWEFEAPLNRDSGANAFIFGSPPLPAAGFDGPAFTLSANLDDLLRKANTASGAYSQSGISFMNPPNPAQLSAVRNRGGKILIYHGASDAIFSVNDSKAYIERLNATNNCNAQSFARLFPVPGMGHCSGGPATDQADFLEPLVNWVEHGQAPERIAAVARGPGNAGGVNADLPPNWAPNRSRPLCVYPKVAHFTGQGNAESESAFVCR
jgi:pimeloyl-ACP methyl ester carboxylesterase